MKVENITLLIRFSDGEKVYMKNVSYYYVDVDWDKRSIVIVSQGQKQFFNMDFVMCVGLAEAFEFEVE